MPEKGKWVAERSNPSDPDSWEWSIIELPSRMRIATDLNETNAKLIAEALCLQEAFRQAGIKIGRR